MGGIESTERQNGLPPKHGAKTLPGGKSSGSKAPFGFSPSDGELTHEQAKEKCKEDKSWCFDYCTKIEEAGAEKAPKWITEHKLTEEDEDSIKKGKCKGVMEECEKRFLWWKCYREINGGGSFRSGKNGSDQNNTGLIIAGAIAVIVLLAAAIGVYLFCCKGGSGGKSKGTRGTGTASGKRSIKSGKKSTKSKKSKAGSSKSKKSKKSSKSKKSKK